MTKPKILIVEDEIIIAMDLKHRIISLGYEVIAVLASVKDCIRKLKTEKPDLILMDIILKGELDGIEVSHIIKLRYNIPIIYLTAHTDAKTIERAKITQPYGYILKPYDLKDLQAAIEIALYRHSMETKLADSEIKYKTLVQAATDAVLILDEDGQIISYNPKLSQMFDYAEDELSFVNIKKLLPSVFINHMVEGIKKFLSVGKYITGDILELNARAKNGLSFPVEISFSQWKGDGNKLFSTLIIRDITKRKESEEALQKAHTEMEVRVEERTIEIKALTDQSPFPICVYNTEGFPIYINIAWQKLWGQNPEYLVKEKYNVLTDPHLEHYGFSGRLREVFNTGGSFKTRPLYYDPVDFPEFRHTDGKLFIFNFYALLNEREKVFQVVSFIEDITERVKAEEVNLELQSRKQRSAAMLDMLEEERYRISRDLHDSIGQMLSAIKFNIEVFEKSSGIESKQIDEAKRIIMVAGKELKSIIRSLHPVIIDNYGMFAALEMLVKEFEESSRIKLSFEVSKLDERLDKKIELNVFRIVQEALNNIVKHSASDSASLRLFIDSGQISIIIKDNGKGFEISNFEDVIFGNQSFGLINMKERTEMLGGSFLISSATGKGTEINIEIPLCIINGIQSES